MVTVTWAGLLVETSPDREVELMVRLKISLSSNKSSSVIETLKPILVCPAGKKISYGPGL